MVKISPRYSGWNDELLGKTGEEQERVENFRLEEIEEGRIGMDESIIADVVKAAEKYGLLDHPESEIDVFFYNDEGKEEKKTVYKDTLNELQSIKDIHRIEMNVGETTGHLPHVIGFVANCNFKNKLISIVIKCYAFFISGLRPHDFVKDIKKTMAWRRQLVELGYSLTYDITDYDNHYTLAAVKDINLGAEHDDEETHNLMEEIEKVMQLVDVDPKRFLKPATDRKS